MNVGLQLPMLALIYTNSSPSESKFKTLSEVQLGTSVSVLTMMAVTLVASYIDSIVEIVAASIMIALAVAN